MKGPRVRHGLAAFVLSLVVVEVIAAMPHGYPPWSGVNTQTIFSLPVDMGELAARLGSIDTFDRRGNVIWMSSFEDGLAQVSPGRAGTGADVYVSALEAKSGAYSVKLIGGSDGERVGSALKALAYPVLGRIGFESGVLVNSDVDYLQWSIWHWDGASGERYTVRWYPSTETLVYVDAASAEQTISADVPYINSGSLWNIIKLVVDLETGEYARVVVDDQGFPLEGIPGEPYIAVSSRFIQVEAAVYSRAGNNDHAWVDDYIVTQNEP
jgi:hypothetical protein